MLTEEIETHPKRNIYFLWVKIEMDDRASQEWFCERKINVFFLDMPAHLSVKVCNIQEFEALLSVYIV